VLIGFAAFTESDIREAVILLARAFDK